MRSSLYTILFSISVTLLISIGLGFSLSSFFGFWQGTSLAFIAQILIYFFYRTKNINSIEKIEAEASNIIEDVIQKSLVDVSCPCGEFNDKVPFFELQESLFTCKKCSSKYTVEAIFNSILQTEPVNLETAFNALKGVKDKELL